MKKLKNPGIVHPYLGEPKENVTTSIPSRYKRFVEEKGLKYNLILIEGIKGFMGEGEFPQTKEELRELIAAWAGRYNRLQRFMVKTLGEEKTEMLIAEAESVGRMVEKLEKRK